MANYEIGTLLLKLGYENQEQFDAGLTNIERKIDAADAAGKRFYDSSREGYKELKALAERGSAGVDELTESFVSGKISAGEYADAVAQLARIQALAERNGGKLRTTLEGVVVAERKSAEAIADLERDMAGLAGKVGTVERELSQGGKTAEELRSRLRLLRSELSQLKDQAGSALPGDALSSIGSRLGAAEGQVRFTADPRDFQEADEVADYLKRINAEFARTGDVAKYRAALESVVTASERLSKNVYEGHEAVTSLSVSAGRAATELKKLGTSAQSAELKRYTDRLTLIEALHRAGVTTSRQYQKEITELGNDALKAAGKFDRLSDEYLQYVNVAGRAGAQKQRVTEGSLRGSFFSKEFILGNALSNIYGELGIRLIDFVSNGVRAMGDLSAETERARDRSLDLLKVAREQGAEYGELQGVVAAIADKYYTLASDGEAAAAALLSSGYSVEQTRALLDAVGAAALDSGADVREAFASIAGAGGDVEGALTAATGANEAYERSLLAAAGGQQELVAGLSQTERQAALVAASTQSSATAQENYARNSDGVTGASLRQTQALQKMQEAWGRELGPAVEKNTELLTIWTGVLASAAAPVGSAADFLASLAGHFSATEVSMIALVAAGPGLVKLLTQIPTLVGGISKAMAVLNGFLGPVGWAALAAGGAAALLAYLDDGKTAAETLEASLESLDSGGAAAAGALAELKSSTDDDGLLGAVKLLASTMDGEAAQAFLDFADDAVASADTTVGAIDAIYQYLAEKRAQAVQDTLDDVRNELAPLLEQQAASEDFAKTGDGGQLKSLQDEKASLEAQLAELKRANEGDVSNDTFFDNLDQIDLLEGRLKGVSGEVARLQSQGSLFGAAVSDEDEQATAARVKVLQETEQKLTQRLNLLKTKPRQAVNVEFGLNRNGSNPNSPAEPTGPAEDPAAELRGSLDEVKAQYKLLQDEFARSPSDEAFVAMNEAGQTVLTTTDALISKLAGLSSSTSQQRVEAINLRGEYAALQATLAGSAEVERERKAGEWIEGLGQRVKAEELPASAAMRELTQAKKNLQGELKALGPLNLLDAAGKTQFSTLQRLLAAVSTGIEDVQKTAQQAQVKDLFRGARESIRALVAEQKRLPENLLVNFEAGGGNREIFDDYNAGFEQADERAQALLGVQAELELSTSEMADAQRLNGEAVAETENRMTALAEAISAAKKVGTPEGDLFAAQAEREYRLLEGRTTREKNLAAAAAETVAQRELAAKALRDADGPVQTFSKTEDTTALERAQSRFNSLRSSLDGLEPGSLAARTLTEELGRAGAQLDLLTAAGGRNAASFGDGGVAYTVSLARREYGSFEEAVKGLNLTLESTGPLMDALRESYLPPELMKSITAYGELETAIRKVEEAQADGRRPPQWALDFLQGKGYEPEQVGLSTFAPESANIEAANKAIAEFRRGLKGAAATESTLLSLSGSLKDELKTLASAEVFDQAAFDAAKAKLAEVLALYRQLKSKRVKLEFIVAQAQTGEVSDDAALAALRERATELKTAMAGLDTQTTAGKEKWLVYQNELEGVQSQMEGLTSVAGTLAGGLREVSGAFRNGGQVELANAAEFIAGAFDGLDKVLKGGSITDGVLAIGAAFQASSDQGMQAMGNLLTGAATLAEGIATGDPGSIIGGALSLLTGIIDIFTAGSKALAEALSNIRDYERGFNVVDATGSKFSAFDGSEATPRELEIERDVLDTNRDGQVSNDETEAYDAAKPMDIPELVAAFESLEGALKSLLKEKLLAYIETGSLDGFEDGVKDAVLEALVEGFIASGVFQAILGEPLNNYVKVAQNPDATPEQRAEAMDGLTRATQEAEQVMIDFGNDYRESKGEPGWTPEAFDASSQLGSSLMSVDFAVGDTSDLEDFQESFGNSLRDYLKKQLIDAFLQSAAIKPLLDELGAYLGEALADGVIDAGEQATIDGFVNQLTRATLPLQEALKGLDSGSKIDVLVDRGNLNDLLAEWDTVGSDAYLETKRAELEEQKRLNDEKIKQLEVEEALLLTQRAQLIAAGVAASDPRVAALDEAFDKSEALLRSYQEQNLALDRQAEDLEGLRGKDLEKLTVAIKAELGIDQPSIRESLKGAFSADSYSEFLDEFASSLKDILGNALLELFLSSGPMAKGIEQLSNEAFNYLRDGQLSGDEKNRLLSLGKDLTEGAAEYYGMLADLGFITPDFSQVAMPELYDDRSQAALDEISSRLGTTADDFAGTLRGAFDADNLEDFRAKLKAGVKQSIRDAMIAAFLESAAIKPLLDALSQGVLDAMQDGELSGDEKDYLLGLQASLGIASEEFFGVLDELGLGFSDLNENLSEVNESLTNVPTGFRVALNRYRADDPNTRPGDGKKKEAEENIKPVQPRDPVVTAKDPFEGADPVEPIREEMDTWEAPDWVTLFNGIFGTPVNIAEAFNGLFGGDGAAQVGSAIDAVKGLLGGGQAGGIAAALPSFSSAPAAPTGALAAALGRVTPVRVAPTPRPAQSSATTREGMFSGSTFVFQTHEGFDTDALVSDLERKGAARGVRLSGSRVAVNK